MTKFISAKMLIKHYGSNIQRENLNMILSYIEKNIYSYKKRDTPSVGWGSFHSGTKWQGFGFGSISPFI